LSRCQRFSFRRISQEDIASRLQFVAYQESIDLDESAARVLARLADGGMRDGLSLLDQCASSTVGELTAERVYECLGIAGEQRCAELMTYIGKRDSAKALSLFNQLYAQGKDLGAMLDEMACLTRDLMILKTAGKSGITMLSGIADEQEAMALLQLFSDGELLRMMTLLQETLAGFTRSSSRRMDAELCILSLCQPSLALDAQSLNARLTHLEEQIRTGAIEVAFRQEAVECVTPQESEVPKQQEEMDTAPVIAEDADTPIGFWADVVSAVRKELKPPACGFFTTTPNAPVKGILSGNQIVLQCSNNFAYEMVNKPEILSMLAKKASSILGRQVTAKIVDSTSIPTKNAKMESLLNFSKEHPDIINIQNN
jgi:DNA polymerase-3 subunit gamma/tau